MFLRLLHFAIDGYFWSFKLMLFILVDIGYASTHQQNKQVYCGTTSDKILWSIVSRSFD